MATESEALYSIDGTVVVLLVTTLVRANRRGGVSQGLRGERQLYSRCSLCEGVKVTGTGLRQPPVTLRTWMWDQGMGDFRVLCCVTLPPLRANTHWETAQGMNRKGTGAPQGKDAAVV